MEIFVQKYSNFQIIFSFQNYQYEYQYSEQNLWIYSNILRTLIVTIDNNIIPWVKNCPLIRNDSIAKRHRQRMSVCQSLYVCLSCQSVFVFVCQSNYRNLHDFLSPSWQLFNFFLAYLSVSHVVHHPCKKRCQYSKRSFASSH